MSLIAKDLPTLIFMLLPGFIAAGVFYTLTAHPKTSEFERLIQSLIFTSFTKALVTALKLVFFRAANWLHISWGSWDADIEFGWSTLIAVGLGLIFAVSANRNLFHGLFRRLRLTKRTSYPSEWYSAFNRKPRYVILHLEGDRRLRGWPEEWPDQPDKGHFIIHRPEWILDDNQPAPLYEVSLLMIPASEVKMVEFLKTGDEVIEPITEIQRIANLLIDVRVKKEASDGSQSPPTTAQ